MPYGCPSVGTQIAMINCINLKWLGGFNIVKNLFIITKYQSFGTAAGLAENESVTRIKEHPSYIVVFHVFFCYIILIITRHKSNYATRICVCKTQIPQTHA